MSQQSEGSSSKRTCVSMDLPVRRSIRKTKLSKTSGSDANSIRETLSQEFFSEDSVSSSTILMDSEPKTLSGKKKISVNVRAKKRSVKLRGQVRKKPIKTRHIKAANPKLSEKATKENLSERNSGMKKAPAQTMLKWLESPASDRPSTSRIRSPNRHLNNKSSEDDSLSVTPGEESPKNKSSKTALKPPGMSDSNDPFMPGKINLENREHEKKTRQTRKKVKKNSSETAKPKKLRSTPKNKTTKEQLSEPINSNDVSSRKRSCNNKKKPPTEFGNTMSFNLDNSSQDMLRSITMQDIFGSDTFSPEALKPKKRGKDANSPELSESFKKYGMEIPTVQEILASRKELEIYSALVDKAKIIPLSANPFINVPKQPVKEPMKLLDCKHLSLEEIKKQFVENKTTLQNIKNGTQYSEKHQHFHRSNSCFPPYNPSNLVFSFPQINLMANLLREEFDPEEKLLRYTFSVLIPELCLLIFMHTHKITREETVKYLDEHPIEDSVSSSTISIDQTPKTRSGKKRKKS